MFALLRTSSEIGQQQHGDRVCSACRVDQGLGVDAEDWLILGAKPRFDDIGMDR